MKKIKISDSDIAVGKKMVLNMALGADILLGNIGFSFVRLRDNGSQRAVFFVFQFPALSLVSLYNGHTGLYTLNQIIDGCVCILNQTDGLHVVNKTETNRTIQVSYF